MFRAGYAASVRQAAKELVALNKKITAAEAAIAKKSTPEAAFILGKKTIARLETEKTIAELKERQGIINLALGFKNEQSLPTNGKLLSSAGLQAKQLVNEHPNAFSLMKELLTSQAAICENETRWGVERNDEVRSSDYVKAGQPPIAGAPGLINGAIKAAWYTVAVVPLVNLPYRGIKRGLALAENVRLKNTLADAPTVGRSTTGVTGAE